MIYNGALANSPAGTPKSLTVTSNVELAIDFVNAGVTGYPQGGLKVHADILGIDIRYIKDPVWPFADCSIWVRPDTATIDASAKINSALLPNAPLQLNPITAYWDNDPSITREKGNWTCSGYLLDEWWDGLWGTGADVATQLEDELNGQAQDLVNDLWADNVTPVINSLNEFGLAFNQITGSFTLDGGNAYTDDLRINGPAAEIRVRGRTGLKLKDYDQTMEVLPRAGSVLPAIGALAGGPAGAAIGAVAQAMLQKPIKQTLRTLYRVQGSWSEPDIDVIERGPAAAGSSSGSDAVRGRVP
jgi:hypothetical protein